MVFNNLIDERVPGWNTKEIAPGKTINALFHIENIPLWWFYSRLLPIHVLPKQLQPLSEQEKPSIKNDITTFGFKKYLYYNEKIKQNLANISISATAEKKALLFTYTNHKDLKTGKVYRLQSIFYTLQQQKKLTPFFLFTDPLSERSYRIIRSINNCPQQETIYSYVGTEEKKNAKAIAKELWQEWKNIDKQSLFGKEWEKIKHTMSFFFSYECMYNTILYYLTSKKIIAQQNVNVVILTSRNGFYEKCMIAAAHNTKTPTIILQHGLGLGVFDPETFPGVKHAVFGEIYQQRLQQWGINNDDIFIIGPTISDEILPFLKKSSVKKGKVVLITVPFVEEHRLTEQQYREYVHKIFLAIKKFPEIVIKLHPREKNKNLYYEEISKAGIQHAMISDAQGNTSLYTILQDAELVINFFSTVALEAMILDKPVLTIDAGVGTVPHLEETPFTGTVIADINSDIEKAITDALNNRKYKEIRRKTVKKFCYKIDGKSSQRLAREIYNLIERKVSGERELL